MACSGSWGLSVLRRLTRACACALLAIVVMPLSGCSSSLHDLARSDDPRGTEGSVLPAASPPLMPRAPRQASSAIYPDGNVSAPQRTRILEGSGQLIQPTSSVVDRVATASGSTTLNLVNVSVAQASKAVLSDVLHVNYVVDERVKGNVSLQTEQVDTKTLVRMFEAALKSAGAVVVQDGSYYRVIPADGAAVAGSRIETGRQEGRNARIGQRVQVIQLKFIAAREMNRILRPMLRKDGVLSIDEVRNLITVNGNDQEIGTVLDAVKVFDVNWMKGMSFALVPLSTSEPEAIAAELDTVFFNDRNGPSRGVVRFVPNHRLNAILVITSQPKYLAQAEAWVRRLDGASRNGEEQLYVYHIQNRPAGELAQVLRRVFATGGEQTAQAQDGVVAPRFASATSSITGQAQSTGLAAMGAAPVGLAAPGSMLTRPVDATMRAAETLPQDDNLAATQPAQATASAAPGPKIKVVADEANNALFITARPVDYKKVLKVLERADLNPNQVLLEATIFEVTLNDTLKFGLRWHIEKGHSSSTLSDLVSGAVAPAFPGFSYFFASNDIQVALNALASITKVKVISSPSVMVMDNKTAVLQVGDKVPITTQSAASVLTPGAPVVNSVQYQDTGVILSVTPRVADNGRVTLVVEQEVSDVTKTTSSGIDSPTIQQRKIKTTVAVNDGESLALGGLIQDRKTTEKGQVPILGDIPVLGAAFRDKTDSIDRTELLILITPRVVRDASEARYVTDEFRQRLDVPSLSNSRRAPTVHDNLDRIFR